MARPQQPETLLVPHGLRRKVKDVLGQMSAKHIDSLESNSGVDACCRKAKDHEVQLFKTDPALKEANVMILFCSCGARHIRLAAGPGVAG
jgi:hypothetical protein